MIILAEATTFRTLASQLSKITGGEDGLNSKNPAWLSSSFERSPMQKRCLIWL